MYWYFIRTISYDNMNLGGNRMATIFCLRELLKSQNISESELASEEDIRRGTLYAICNNQVKQIPKDVISKICRGLHKKGISVQPGDWIKYIPDPD